MPKFLPQSLPDVVLVEPDVHHDPRGFFVETWQIERYREAGIGPDQIGTLITNQPNRIFLRNWRDALQVPEDKHVDTFEEHGNTFGAAIPISRSTRV